MEYLILEHLKRKKKELSDQRLIEIYPNPANDMVTIEFSSSPEMSTRIILVDIHGKYVLTHEVKSLCEILNTQTLAKGMYLIYILRGIRFTATKLIVN